MLNNLSIRTKLWSLVFAAAAAVFCVAGAALWFSYDHMYQDRVLKLQALVEAGHSLASNLEAQAASGKVSRSEAQARFKEALLAIRYSGGEYVFAHTYCPSSGNLRLIRHFEKRGSGSSRLEFKRPAVGAASVGSRQCQV